ncbi:MAG: GGDEF domain-containing protein [Alteromonadaceae bacterium]|nr:MAG: GGDEF domain-containing protein [Alteromonadaceae bacterium]
MIPDASSKGVPARITKTDMTLVLFALLSLTLIFVPSQWLTRSKAIDMSDYRSIVFNDHDSGGSSTVSWLDKESLTWRCIIPPNTANPYCGFQLVIIDDKGRGLNLDKYSAIKIWVKYEGSDEYLRFFLRNRNPAYFQVDDLTSTKYNSVELQVKDLLHGKRINLKDFQVAQWWLVQKKIPIEMSHPEFSDILFLELHTGSSVAPGEHTVSLTRIELSGILFSKEQLYRAIVIIWSAVILLLLVYRLLSLRRTLVATIHYQAELVSINRLLNLQNKKFEDLAKTDALTGALNRVGIREALYEGLNDWKNKRQPFSFVLLDIDYFKKINDTYGHDVGDEILKGLASLFSGAVRKTDFFARWGGEEFILVCANTDLEQAVVVAELLRKKLAEASLHPDVKVTASFGVASMTEANLDLLFKQADEALFEAKADGRNCVASKA